MSPTTGKMYSKKELSELVIASHGSTKAEEKRGHHTAAAAFQGKSDAYADIRDRMEDD